MGDAPRADFGTSSILLNMRVALRWILRLSFITARDLESFILRLECKFLWKSMRVLEKDSQRPGLELRAHIFLLEEFRGRFHYFTGNAASAKDAVKSGRKEDPGSGCYWNT